MKRYPNAKELVWCQEEPLNQGAWYPSTHRLDTCREGPEAALARPASSSASPGRGDTCLHKHSEQKNAALTLGA
jgi:2-oxoglutarate dehydrogenase E1 component